MVQIGRLVREDATVVVQAPSRKAIDVDAVYDQYEGSGWEPDLFWGAEPSDSHGGILGRAPKAAVVDVNFTEINLDANEGPEV
jgi:hypothetical protein